MVPIPSMLYEFDTKLIHQLKKINKQQGQLEEVKEEVKEQGSKLKKLTKKDSKRLVTELMIVQGALVGVTKAIEKTVDEQAFL